MGRLLVGCFVFRTAGIRPLENKMDGALAQLVERNTGSVEVSGSTPLGSTIFQNMKTQKKARF
jgi:hypothetical protein